MRFTKMHGIGNDYVYIDAFQNPISEPEKLAIKIADRHFGVGGDGLILIAPPTQQAKADGAHVRMRMFNADGSESEMCGNGIRCVAKYAFDHQLSNANPMRIETGRGILTLQLFAREGKVHEVTVNMGQPILESEKIPTTFTTPRVVDLTLADLPPGLTGTWQNDCGLDPHITCVSVGNPHVTMYCKDVSKVPLATVGPIFEHWNKFPKRINVHFVQVHSPTEITMRTWERGSGITLACGTGASAVCVSGVLTNRTQRGILAHLPGGDLKLEWRQSDNAVYMTGPATEVFSGDYNP